MSAANVIGVVVAILLVSGVALFTMHMLYDGKVYFDFSDWWVGYYRSDRFHYVCPLPTVVVRWARKPPRRPVVHLMNLALDDGFTQCCRVNWRALLVTGMITENADLVTCKGREQP